MTSTASADELSAIRAFAERFAALQGGWGGALSLALGPAALRRRRRGGRGLDDGSHISSVSGGIGHTASAATPSQVVFSDHADASALDFAVQPVVPAAMAAAARQKSSNNDWEIRL
jgi:hypothetical protein